MPARTWFGPWVAGMPAEPSAGQLVISLSGAPLGIVRDVSPGAFLVQLSDGRDLWVSNWTIGWSSPGALRLLGEAWAIEPVQNGPEHRADGAAPAGALRG